MKNLYKFFILFFGILAFLNSTYGQNTPNTSSQQNWSEVVTIKDGRKVIIKSDGTWKYQIPPEGQETAQKDTKIEAEQSLKDSELVSLEEVDYSADAIEALTKTREAVRLGANMIDFRRLVLDCKMAVRKANSVLSDEGLKGELKRELNASVNAYVRYIEIFDANGGRHRGEIFNNLMDEAVHRRNAAVVIQNQLAKKYNNRLKN